MATDIPTRPEVARVDYLVDENGARLDLPDDTGLKVATAADESVGGTGPSGWWRIGLVALAVLALVLLITQVMSGGAGTEMIPGTPTVAPQPGTPVAPVNP